MHPTIFGYGGFVIRVRYNMNYRHIFDALSLVFFPLLKKVNCMLDLNHGPLNVSASIGDA